MPIRLPYVNCSFLIIRFVVREILIIIVKILANFIVKTTDNDAFVNAVMNKFGAIVNPMHLITFV